VKEKIMNLSNIAVSRYNEVIGFDEIEQAYSKVTLLQEELAKTQNERTNLHLQLNHIRSDISSIQNEFHDLKRGEVKYLELMRKGERIQD
jgi:septal ring factor EnvC (AmiA/AmiB activator)